ncbi:hypothetical protein EVAR_88281_1 [Eumeta japonica]|uniref:Uncharacterized protein n=1 Tax=Eumeta variegata TaxID=151549 RepID=A0A4C1XLJ8_EUMVA|nr:hypothetical protein EVAR_88281_1 [Eumeta japonica]
MFLLTDRQKLNFSRTFPRARARHYDIRFEAVMNKRRCAFDVVEATTQLRSELSCKRFFSMQSLILRKKRTECHAQEFCCTPLENSQSAAPAMGNAREEGGICVASFAGSSERQRFVRCPVLTLVRKRLSRRWALQTSRRPSASVARPNIDVPFVRLL